MRILKAVALGAAIGTVIGLSLLFQVSKAFADGCDENMPICHTHNDRTHSHYTDHLVSYTETDSYAEPNDWCIGLDFAGSGNNYFGLRNGNCYIEYQSCMNALAQELFEDSTMLQIRKGYCSSGDKTASMNRPVAMAATSIDGCVINYNCNWRKP